MGGGAGERGEVSGERTRFEITTKERRDRTKRAGGRGSGRISGWG